MEAGGNVFRMISVALIPLRAWQVTVETSWCTCLKLCISSSAGVSTVPGSALRVRSFRTRSTTLRFSLTSLGLAASWVFRRSSCLPVLPRGAVPLMGWEIRVLPFLERNRSGEAERMYLSPYLKKHENGVGDTALSL